MAFSYHSIQILFTTSIDSLVTVLFLFGWGYHFNRGIITLARVIHFWLGGATLAGVVVLWLGDKKTLAVVIPILMGSTSLAGYYLFS